MTETDIEIQVLEQEIAARKGSLTARSHINFCVKCHKHPANWPSRKCVDCNLEDEANAKSKI